MSIQPKGDPIRNAVRWISDERQHGEVTNLNRLVEQAAVRFNLNPKDVEYLLRLVKGETS
ncbi:MAG: hypothetical protein QNI88_16185 [Desulfobacterales bacterium]|nr:hypothetical protein [Desulfobacterales bacterium]